MNGTLTFSNIYGGNTQAKTQPPSQPYVGLGSLYSWLTLVAILVIVRVLYERTG